MIVMILVGSAPANPDGAANGDQLVEGWTQLFLSNFHSAEEAFSEVLRDRSGKEKRLAEIGLILVDRYNESAFDREATRAALEGALAETPMEEKKLRTLLLFQLALVYQPTVQEGPEEAARLRNLSLPYYDQIVEENPRSELAAVALVDWARAKMKIDPQANAAEVAARLEGALEEEQPETAQRFIYQWLCYQYRLSEDWQKTVFYMEKWHAVGIESEWLRAQTVYAIGTIYDEKLHRPADALPYYDLVDKDYSFFNYAGEARRRAEIIRSKMNDEAAMEKHNEDG